MFSGLSLAQLVEVDQRMQLPQERAGLLRGEAIHIEEVQHPLDDSIFGVWHEVVRDHLLIAHHFTLQKASWVSTEYRRFLEVLGRYDTTRFRHLYNRP